MERRDFFGKKYTHGRKRLDRAAIGEESGSKGNGNELKDREIRIGSDTGRCRNARRSAKRRIKKATESRIWRGNITETHFYIL